jgi:hypothetical protein
MRNSLKKLVAKVIKFSKKNWIFLIILTLGFSIRIIKAKQLFMYSHDQDLASWIIKDILVNKHLRLIGQETSVQGVFIGPIYYYLLIPFYLLFNFDPIGGIMMVTIISTFTILSLFLVFSSVFNKRTALIATLIYSISLSTVMGDREVVPTMPVIIWSIWYFYSLIQIAKGNQRIGFILSGVLLGLLWHLNLALILLIPLIPVALLISKRKVIYKEALYGLVLLFLFSIPLILFEVRHNFIQTSSVVSSLAVGGGEFPGGMKKFDWIINIVSKNVFNLFVGVSGFPAKYVLYALLIMFLFIILKKIIDWKVGLISFLWLFIYIVFFSVNSIIPSEYYFNGMVVIWIAIFSLFMDYITKQTRYKYVGFLFLIFFGIYNILKFANMNINRSGYIERKQLVSYIKEDAEKHEYPCVSVSYITDPGYDLGYRYLYWLENMHVNNPDSGSPVYSIVFPHSKVNSIDVSFGALGLIMPDYEKYSKDEILISCSGKNSNDTNPMFGYTE